MTFMTNGIADEQENTQREGKKAITMLRTLGASLAAAGLSLGMLAAAPGAVGEPAYTAVLNEGNSSIIYTDGGRLTIQMITGTSLNWNSADHEWTGSDAGEVIFNMAAHESTGDGPGNYGAELNVKGRLVYGYNWSTDGLAPGEYRLTFSVDEGYGTDLKAADIVVPVEEELEAIVAAEPEEGGSGGGNVAYVDNEKGVTWIDVELTSTSAALDALALDLRAEGGEETAGNNLSYPTLWAEELSDTRPVVPGVMGEEEFGEVVSGTVSDTDPAPCLAAVQKSLTNSWQADNVDSPGTQVTHIDWGDNLEAKDWPLGRGQIRVETVLFVENLEETMTGYDMCYVSGAMSKDELWGARVEGGGGSDPSDPSDPPVSGGGGGGGAPVTPPEPAPVGDSAGPGPQAGQPEDVTAVQAATAPQRQRAKLGMPKSGKKFAPGTVRVLTDKPIKTTAGVTVRWRVTTKSRDYCSVKTLRGTKNPDNRGKTLLRMRERGNCTVVAWAPAPSPEHLQYRKAFTYRIGR